MRSPFKVSFLALVVQLLVGLEKHFWEKLFNLLGILLLEVMPLLMANFFRLLPIQPYFLYWVLPMGEMDVQPLLYLICEEEHLLVLVVLQVYHQ